MTDNVSKFISILLLFQSTPLWADSAVMAAGDMWRAEIIYEAVPGVTRVEPGYVTPELKGNPDAEKRALRRQAVRIEYDPALVGYGDLLNIFWQLVDGNDGADNIATVVRHLPRRCCQGMIFNGIWLTSA